jgi:glutamate-5-semialdehyde dehydrogenase
MENDVKEMMMEIGRRAQAIRYAVAHADTHKKNLALSSAADSLLDKSAKILEANAQDLHEGKQKGLSSSIMDRLLLNETRIKAMAKGLQSIAALPDPVGVHLAQWNCSNGLDIARVRMPLGVIGVIYESRPNVTADAAALCLKSGNTVVLRGGSDSLHSSQAIHECVIEGLNRAGLPPDGVQLVCTSDRKAVDVMLGEMTPFIDLVIPRGGRSLVERVQTLARVPVLAHLEGICHTYVEKSADVAMTREVVLNAKMRRPGICGATECLLIDRACLDTHAVPVIQDLLHAGCEVRGDARIQQCHSEVKKANDDDWGKEYLDTVIAVRCVENIQEAIAHIRRFSSEHTEAIITEDTEAASLFFHSLDSAILMHNASTQFADGGEFGMGAEIGIATGRLHARGPIGLEQLTTFQYHVKAHGAVRS